VYKFIFTIFLFSVTYSTIELGYRSADEINVNTASTLFLDVMTDIQLDLEHDLYSLVADTDRNNRILQLSRLSIHLANKNLKRLKNKFQSLQPRAPPSNTV
jgi:hypothetical protein